LKQPLRATDTNYLWLFVFEQQRLTDKQNERTKKPAGIKLWSVMASQGRGHLSAA
jgi:hypothetical protein